jgi:ribonucleotide monophosphatase NagD (HAD superfamily)
MDTMVQHYDLETQLDPKKVLMVGDSLASDILGANKVGLSSCLLLTGVTSKAMTQRINKDSQQLPTYQFESL